MSVREPACCKSPEVRTYHGSRPRAVLRDPAAFRREIDQRRHILLIPRLPKKSSHMLEPDHERPGKINSRAQNQCEMRKHRHIGSFRRGRAAARLANSTPVQRQVNPPNASIGPIRTWALRHKKGDGTTRS